MKLLLIISIFTLSLFSNDADCLKETIQNKSDKIISIIKDNSLTKDVKYDKIDDTIGNLFNYKIMAMLSIGKKGRKILDKKQKKEFIYLFTKHIKKSYFDKSDLLADKKILVKNTKKEKSRIFVIAEIISKKETNKLIYKFHNTQKRGWLIYDIEIAGISIITSYRKQFQEILKENNPQKLIDTLK